MKNKTLKTAMFAAGVTHKKAAEKLGINYRVFTNKINHITVNGYQAKFTVAEKALLATIFEIDVNSIE